jgi:hypothetical protein
VVAALVGAVAAISVAGADNRERVVVTDPDGRVLASVPLGTDGTFSLRYRNSLYGSLAAERFVRVNGGGFALDALGAEQLAVLEEYYAVESPPVRGADGWWYAPPAYELELPELRVAATDLGRRTLLVDGRPQVDLWRLVRDARPSVIISVEAAP